MPAYLLYGDNFLVAEALKGFQAQVGPPEVRDANSHRVSAGQTSLPQLMALTSATPFLAEVRLVVVEDLIARFDSREVRRRPSTSATTGRRTSPGPALGDWEGLTRYIQEEMPPTTMLVLVEGRVSKGSALLERLRPVVQVQELPTPSGEGLARWIRNRAAEKEARITPGAIRLLSLLIGGNLWAMDNELEKLSLYSGDRAIEEEDVRLLVSEAREASIFSAVDALLEGKSALALRLMHRLRNDGAELPYIVAMTARQLRLTTLARDLIDAGHTGADIGRRLGLTRDFLLRRTLEQARKHSLGSLGSLYSKLMEADLAVKRGRMDQDVALDLLVSGTSGRPGGQVHGLRQS